MPTTSAEMVQQTGKQELHLVEQLNGHQASVAFILYLFSHSCLMLISQ